MNKHTHNRIRKTIVNFLDKNAEDIEVYYDVLKARDPEKALRFFMELIEYGAPKLSRVETTNETKVVYESAIERARKLDDGQGAEDTPE